MSALRVTTAGKIHPSEDVEAEVLCRWMDIRGITYFHVPNEGNRRPSYAARMKKIGLRPGVPDYVVLSFPTRFEAAMSVPVFLELKSKRGVLSRHQKQWLEWLTENEYTAKCCYGADEAIAWLESLGY